MIVPDGSSDPVPRVVVSGCSLFGPFPASGGPGIAPREHIASRDPRLRHADRVTLLCLRGASLAVEDAGWAPEDPRRETCGLSLGNAYGAYEADLAHQRTVLKDGGRAASPAVFTLTLPNVAAGWISILERLKGPLATYASGLLAPAEAIARAFLDLRAGEPGPFLAGGAQPFQEDVHDVLERARRGGSRGPVSEAAAFFVLERAAPPAGAVYIEGAGLARASGGTDPMEEALRRAGAVPSAESAALVAGDASRDAEAAAAMEKRGWKVAGAVSGLLGDLGEAACAAGAALAVRWLRGLWAPPGASGSPDSVAVAGLDPCGKRAFALRFDKA
jgi:hypothetical protein